METFLSSNFELFVACGLIAIYAIERFNTPTNARASTTAGKYLISVMVYLMIYLLTFLVIVNSPGAIRGLRNWVEGAGFESSGLFASLLEPGGSKFIFVALVLSLLTPKIPVISKIDKKLRAFLHRLALIPFEAIKRSSDLQKMELQIPADKCPVIEGELLNLGFSQDDIDLKSSDDLVHDGFNMVYLITCLNDWDRDVRYASFKHDRATQYTRLHEQYLRQVAMMKNLVHLKSQVTANPGLEVLVEAHTSFRASMRVEHAALLAEVCDFISHGLLASYMTNNAIRKAIEEIGFVFDHHTVSKLKRTVNDTLTLFSLLLIFVLANFIILTGASDDLERTLLLGTMIVSVYSASVVCALFPKRSWSLCKPEDGRYPVMGYFLSGFMAVFSAMVLSLFFNTLIYAADKDINGLVTPFMSAFDRLTGHSYPWMLMSFVTAASTAFLADWDILDKGTDLRRRSLDAVVTASVLVGAVYLVYLWLTAINTGFDAEPTRLMITSGGIGLIIGFIVPSWYRLTYASELARVTEGKPLDQAP